LINGAEAVAEFQKILDHQVYAPLSPLHPFAHLGLARAAALTGDTARSRRAYDDYIQHVVTETNAYPPIAESLRSAVGRSADGRTIC